MVNNLREGDQKSPEKGPEKPDPILELRNIMRSAAGEALKPKAQKVIEAKVKGFSYKIQVAACETPEDFRRLFALHHLEQEVYRSSQKLVDAGYQQFQTYIAQRFNGWRKFLEFIGSPAKPVLDKNILNLSYLKQVAACETPEEFRILFSLYQLSEDVWSNAKKLADAGYFAIQILIAKRFNGWDKFRDFMGLNILVLDKTLLQYSYTKQISICTTPSDFRTLFALHKIPQNVWENAGEMERANFQGLQAAIAKRFTGWDKFRDFMGLTTLTLDKTILSHGATKQISACETSNDFRTLFKLHKISEDVWRRSDQLKKAGYPGLQGAIAKRFNGWEKFLDFMGFNTLVLDKTILRHAYTRQVSICITPNDFRTLFALHKIPQNVWENAGEMERANFPGLQTAIAKRFTGWDKFRDFMGLTTLTLDETILRHSYPKQISICSTPDDFRTLFALHKIPEDVWRLTDRIRKAGFSGLTAVISQRFNGWDSFLSFMGKEVFNLDLSILSRSYPDQISACKTPDDFRTLFALHKISEDVWRGTDRLKKAGFQPLSALISKRFHGWEKFIDWMDGRDEESIDRTIEKLNLTEAIALLGSTPSKLKLYIKIAHPELAEKDIDTIVGTSFKRLTVRKSFDYSEFEPGLGPITLHSQSFKETSEPVYLITGFAPGADSVMVSGHREIRVRTNPDGSFRVRVPLSIGELNEITLIPINHTDKTIGEEISISVQQTSEPDDIEALIKLLDAMGKAALDDIRQDPGRFNYVVQQTEQVLIRKFSKNFEEGRDYVEGLIATTKSAAVKKVLKKVLDNFRRIDRTTYPNVKKDSPLYFFQKYCVAEIQRRMAKGDAGVILANAPGLGKTRTALVAVNGDPATIIAPNSVVSAWGEEAEKCLIDSNVLTLRNLHSKKRIEKLQKNNGTHVVTNVEFLRAHPNDPRYALLANEETVIVQDEAHGLANLHSEQSKGARRLNGKFQLLLSATPFKDPKMMRRMFHHLYPHDVRFSSDKAFAKAFPANDHEALRTLSILKDQFVIRFRKEDVLEEMDPKIPVEDQKHRLPKKEHIPPEKHGTFTMTMKQAEATYELFKDWGKWTKKYDKYVPKDEIAKMDHLRGNEFTFGKLHALRQIANNPAYVGEKGVEDPKATQMKRAVEKCLKEGRKVVIFCQYNAQAEKYAELLKKYAPSLYTGVTSKEGNMKNSAGKEMLFKKHEKGGWAMDRNGYPVQDPEGAPMLAMDYERITYQNTQDRKVMIATYSAGAVGVTFTAGKAVIFDDLPRDCTEEIQAEDRTHRIDHEHQTHHTVTYMKMASAYPQAFLEKMKKTWVKKKDDGTYEETMNEKYAKKHGYVTAYNEFFEQGTWDQVKIGNLQAQRNMFDLLNDGIIDNAEATREVKPFSVSL